VVSEQLHRVLAVGVGGSHGRGFGHDSLCFYADPGACVKDGFFSRSRVVTSVACGAQTVRAPFVREEEKA